MNTSHDLKAKPINITCQDGDEITLEISASSDPMDEGFLILSGYSREHEYLDAKLPIGLYSKEWMKELVTGLKKNPEFRRDFFQLKMIESDFKIPSPKSDMDKALNRLLTLKDKAKFQDYMKLKSGRDAYSSLKGEELKSRISQNDQERIDKRNRILQEDDKAKIYRWILRGLPVDMAISKFKIDNAIAQKAIEKANSNFRKR